MFNNQQYTLSVNGKNFGRILISSEENIWYATCLYSERQKRMFKAVGQEGSNSILKETKADTTEKQALERLLLWAKEEFGDGVDLKKIS